MIALADESIATEGGGIYVVAAVLVRDSDREEARRDLRRLVPPGHRFHFHRERPQTRLGVIGLLGEAAVAALVYRVDPVPSASHEDARRRCLEGLFGDVEKHELRELIVESREEHNDVKDRRTIAAAQRAGLLPRHLLYGHRRGREEPLLWLADALAGAGLADARRGARRRANYLAAIPPGLLTVRHP